MKLSGNFLLASVIESLGEAMALVGKAGVDRRQYLDFLTSTLFDAPVYKTYGGLIADGKFEPAAFAAPLGHKDIRLALAAAEDLRVPMPLASLLRDRFLTLLAHGGDNSTGRRSAGLRPRTPQRCRARGSSAIGMCSGAGRSPIDDSDRDWGATLGDLALACGFGTSSDRALLLTMRAGGTVALDDAFPTGATSDENLTAVHLAKAGSPNS